MNITKHSKTVGLHAFYRQSVEHSRLEHCSKSQFSAQVVYIHVPLTPSSIICLVPANGRWCSAAGEVTTGLAQSNGSRVYGFGHLQADCRGPGSDPEPYAHFEYGTTYLTT